LQTSTDEQAFLSAYVIVRYDDRDAMKQALEQVGRGPVGDRVRSSAVLQELSPERGGELEPDLADHVLFALEGGDQAALETSTSSLTADGGQVVHPPSPTCPCVLCEAVRIAAGAVSPSHMPAQRYLLFVHLRIDRGVRWPQLRTTSVASVACLDGTVVAELTGTDLDVLREDAATLLAAPGVLDGRTYAGAGEDLRQS
jgi:hypothetical protein